MPGPRPNRPAAVCRSPTSASSPISPGAGGGLIDRGTVHAPAAIAMTTSTRTYERDPGVDRYIDRLPGWQQEICHELRDLIHGADPEVRETIKRTVQPYFVLEGNVCALLAAKDHVNLFLYDGTIVPDPEGIITAGHGNRTARTVSFRRGESVNVSALTTMLRHIVANNRAGGWRRLKARQG
jgi:hypothetical protein